MYKNALVLALYLSFKDEIKKLPRCPGKRPHEELLAKKISQFDTGVWAVGGVLAI